MPINLDKLLTRPFPEIRGVHTWRDCVLYALGLGLGSDPLHTEDLRHVYENGLQALPTMACTLGHPGFWVAEPDLGIDFRQVVHGEQSLVIHRPLLPEMTLLGRNAIDEIIDKGAGRGAILRVRRDLYDEATGDLQSSQVMSMFCRANGGFGGPPGGRPVAEVAFPDRPADIVVDRPVPHQAALIYRLSGDLNPLHADPEVARAAGFDRPIYHGLATFGVASLTLLQGCSRSTADLREIGCRFTAPFFPGETLQTEMWQDGAVVLFRCRSKDRDVVVLDRGRALFNL